MNQKIFDINDLDDLVLDLERNKVKLVLVGGCFDILHLGHIQFLEKGKNQGEKLMVLLESDENIKINKGENRPINPQLDRAKILVALKVVDYVILLPKMKSDLDYDKLIKKIKPQIIAITKGDINEEKKRKQAQMVEAKVVTVSEMLNNRSTSKIIDLISRNGL